MSNIKEIIEDFMIRLDLPYKNVEENIWIIDDSEQGLENIAIDFHDEVISLRISVCNIPDSNRKAIFKKLLELNLDLIYGAYGIVEDKIVLTHSILFEEITFDKFASIYSAFTFSMLDSLNKISKELD